MTLAILLTVAAVLGLVLVVRIALSRMLVVKGAGDVAHAIQPLDVEAFRNLCDPDDDDFLYTQLPPADFRRVRRARLRATAGYIRTAGRNAAVLVRLGQSAITSSDPQIAAAALQLVNQALLLRRNTFLALLRIYVALAWPLSRPATDSVLEGYHRLSGSAMLLGKLQNPAVPVRISSTP